MANPTYTVEITTYQTIFGPFLAYMGGIESLIILFLGSIMLIYKGLHAIFCPYEEELAEGPSSRSSRTSPKDQ